MKTAYAVITDARNHKKMNNCAEEFFERVISVRLSDDKKAVNIIDQTLLPNEIKRVDLYTREELKDAIKKLRVRGAPAIGIAAAYGMAVLSRDLSTDKDDFFTELKGLKDYLADSRPTAVNLFWALERMEKKAISLKDKSRDEIINGLYEEAEAIREEDIRISRNIGEAGFTLLSEIRRKTGRPPGILTHCNAGTLATGKYGTATAPMYMALEHGWKGSDMHVYCDETRPLLQGARLTAFELSEAGIDTTLQCDNMAASLMAAGKIDIVFVGCDRVAKNGDSANKIGTSSVAINAGYYGIPFYVCAPGSTIDRSAGSGKDIPIELRSPEEISESWYEKRMAPENIDIYNPAFDVTDHSLITGIITEEGVKKPPYSL